MEVPASDPVRIESERASMPSEPIRESQAAPDIVLTVRGADRRRLSGASVTVLDPALDGALTTDAQGQVLLPLAPDPKQLVKLRVEAPGHFHVNAPFERRSALDIQLPGAALLRGRVLEVGMELPVAGARIQHVHEFCRGCAPTMAMSDASGRFEIPAVPVDRNEPFELSAEGLSDQTVRFSLEAGRDVVEHDFHIDRGVEVVGVVVDFETSAPLSGALIEYEGRALARSGPDGSYSARAVAVGSTDRINLWIGAEGRCKLRRE